MVFVVSEREGLEGLVSTVHTLLARRIVTIMDAATVVYSHDGKIKISSSTNLVEAGSLGGAFWGMLFGRILFMPWMGTTTTNVPAAPEKYTSYGISDSFTKEVGAMLTPGHAALCLLLSSLKEDKIVQVLARHKATLLRLNLSKENDLRLCETFGISERGL